MKSIYKFIILAILLHNAIIQKTAAQNNKTQFTVEIKNSVGEPQNEVFIKISGRSDTYKADSCGIIRFEYDVPEKYKRTANIYLSSNKNTAIRTFTLEKDNPNLFFTIDSEENLLEFKKENNTFGIEGIVTDEEGEPIEGAVVSIQGTGRNAITDEIGLFSIEADFNHYIIIRANGMENMTMNVTPFLTNQNEAYSIKMRPKGENRVYTSVEKKPQYPGGMGSFKRYIDKNLKYPEQAKKDSIEGVVVMQFIVEKNGEITSPRVVRQLEPSLDSIAMNLIKDMPRWNPGSDHGRIVRCKYSVPIAFRIPRPKPVIIKKDSIVADSMRMIKDSLTIDSLSVDSLKNDSLISDSLVMDSLSISNDSIKSVPVKDAVKVKKRNAFVRFFRWLFGIKDKENENPASVEEDEKEMESVPKAGTEEEIMKEEEKIDKEIIKTEENNKK